MRTPLLLGLLATLPLASCELINNANVYPQERIEPLSVQAYAEATGQFPNIDAGADFRMVQDVARRITAATGVNFPWEVKLLDAPDVPNAFCLPNGRIAVYTGILPITQNIDGLAAVVGHEVAHATREHGGKRMTRAAITQLGMQVVSTGLQLNEVDSQTHDVVISALGIGGQYLFTLPYSRDHETEADLEGIRYAIRAGFDPWEAPRLWERMAALGSGGPEWSSTHPDPLNRARRLREEIPKILAEERASGRVAPR